MSMRKINRTKIDLNDQTNTSLSWMVTFSDLLMILLTLFVLRLSMTSIETPEVIKILRSFQESMLLTGNLPGALPSTELEEAGDLTHSEQGATSRLALRLANAVANVTAEPVLGDILSGGPEISSELKIEARDGGTVVFLGGGLFESASDVLSFKAQEAIMAVSKIALEENSLISVSGHTDNVPISNARFSSNWELSSARAIAVVRQMLDAGVSPQAIRAVGYADVKPNSDNQNPQLKHLNRRVEIFLYSRSNH